MVSKKKRTATYLLTVLHLNTPIRRSFTMTWVVVSFPMPSTATTVVFSLMAKRVPANPIASQAHTPTKVLCPTFARSCFPVSRRSRSQTRPLSSRSPLAWLKSTLNKSGTCWIQKAWQTLKVYPCMRGLVKDFTVSWAFYLVDVQDIARVLILFLN